METSNTESDEGLIDAVRRAARSGAPPREIEALVGLRAWINTTREPDDVAVGMVDIGIDEEHSAEPPRLADARDVVYWGRPVEAPNPKLIGIVWDADGRPTVFFGVLYPP